VEARVFVDGLCVRHGKPLIDTGTMGLNGHVQVVLPHLTESYSSSTDPSTPQIPVCSIRSNPTKVSSLPVPLS
jgi:ubiquitin-activating enzyme E1